MPTTFLDNIAETFYVVNCYRCSVNFGVPSQLYRRAVTDAKGSLYCPACRCGMSWQESDDKIRIKQLEQKLQWEADQSQRRKKHLEATQNSLRATKGVVTKLKKRTACGVCPCCKRQFQNLRRHMKTKHPKYAKPAE